jgi:hypothetical protein
MKKSFYTFTSEPIIVTNQIHKKNKLKIKSYVRMLKMTMA